MYTPHSITLYNTVTETNADFSEQIKNYVTVLNGVFVDASKGRNVSTSGLTNADSVNLYIPLDVEAVDGADGSTKEYIAPRAFMQLEDKSGYYTLSFAENALQTFFIKGVAVEQDLSFEEINVKYDDVYTVTKVDLKDFGSENMRHFEVGGA